MKQETFSKEWASLSSEQQEAFRAWVKANLEAKKAKQIFLKKYISKELRQSQGEEFKSDSFAEAAEKNLTNLSINLFNDFVLLVKTKCDNCSEIRDPVQQEECFWNCIVGLVVNWEFDLA